MRMTGALAVAVPLGVHAAPRATAPGAAAGARDNVVLRWNTAILNAVAATSMGPPVVARALAVVNTAMYDAWAAYTPLCHGTQLGGSLRRPPAERTTARKSEAISYAAYRAAANLWPTEQKRFATLMRQLGFDPTLNPSGHSSPPGVGATACAALMAFRQHDGSNQLGDLHRGAYSDYTGYEPSNAPMAVADFKPSTVRNPSKWQPLIYVDSTGKRVTQKFVTPQWNHVVPFALPSDSFGQSLTGPPKHGSAAYTKEAQQLIALSAGLTDEQKMIAEYWQLGPQTVQPPGRWIEIGQYVSRRDHHSLDQDAKMFFALANAVFDAGIAAWNDKRHYDSVRPITSIRYLYHGKKITAWGGPDKGTRAIDGGTWLPYQKATFPTPAFAEYVSAHSTFSGAAAQVLQDFTGSDHFGGSVTLPAGSSVIEPGHTPHHAVKLSWSTFTDAANQAGISRRYGGIHFKAGDLDGRKLGFLVGTLVTAKANEYILGLA
jgi:uncharacterized protein DUF6851/vanadium-dependent haloperoxidase-like protein